MNDKKIVMITNLQPYSNYSSYLATQIAKKAEQDLIVYAEKDEKNFDYKKSFDVRPIWEKNLSFFKTIFLELRKDKPDLIHFQYELNIFGGFLVTVLVPLFILFLRVLFKAKILVTLHAVVPRTIIDKKFISLFKGDSKLPPFLLRLFFTYQTYVLGISAHKIVVHTETLRRTLIRDYKVNSSKVIVIRHGVPLQFVQRNVNSEKYFFYFGYITKRKGLDNLLKGYSSYTKIKGKSAYKLLLGGGVIKGQEFALEDFKELVNNLDLSDYVEFLGFLSKEQMKKYFSDAYCVTIPAVISISASGPLAQSFGYGKCIIASDVGSFSEEIDNKIDGILVDNEKWDKAFCYVHDNGDKVKNIEKKAAMKANRRSWEKVADDHLRLYKELF